MTSMAASHDTVGFWLEQAGKYPLLPRHEMLRLAKIIQDPKVSEAKRQRAINKLVLHNLKLIPRAARRFTGTKRSYNFGDCHTVDFMQAGVFGLKRAAEKYDPERGYAFSTYAMPWIKQSIQRYAYANFTAVRVPESTLRDLFRVNFQNKRTKPDDMNEAAWERVEDAWRALNLASMDVMVMNKHQDDANDLHESIASKDPLPEPKFSFEEIIAGVELSKEEVLILRRYYMENTSMTNIAKEIGKTLESVRKRIPAIVAKIRRAKVLTSNHSFI